MANRILLCVFCIVLFKAEYVPAQTESRPNYRNLVHSMHKTFVRYQEDFLDFARGDEYEPSSDLQQL